MRADEIITRDVITVGPEAKVSEIADLFVRHKISAVPVVTDDTVVVGLVTASDLIHRKETRTERRRKWWLDMFVDSDTRAREFVKEHELKARDVMSPAVISVNEAVELAEVADVLESHRIRRVPVLKEGKLVGLISRADLVRALAKAPVLTSPSSADNATLQKAVYDAVNMERWLNTIYMSFTVHNGVVEVRGYANSDAQKKALRVLIEEVPGVIAVKDGLTIRRWPTAA